MEVKDAVRMGRDKERFLACGGIFCGGVFCGALLPYLAPGEAARMMRLVTTVLEPLMHQMKEKGIPYEAVLVFFHNLKAAAIMIVLGFTLVYPGFSLFFNGVVVGLVLAFVHRTVHLGIGRLLLFVLPHGLFELPALFISASLAWRLGRKIWRRVRGQEAPEVLRSFLLNEAWRSFLLVVFLLALASLMETSVSAAFVRRFLGSSVFRGFFFSFTVYG
ncbi:MAG: stage II sporulation protein M [Bacillota bacterium]